MRQDEFLQLLEKEGFGTTAVVEREAYGTLDAHAHPFEAKALVLSGSLTLRKASEEQTFEVGDVFHLHRDELHSEVFGEQGVRYLVGRK